MIWRTVRPCWQRAGPLELPRNRVSEAGYALLEPQHAWHVKPMSRCLMVELHRNSWLWTTRSHMMLLRALSSDHSRSLGFILMFEASETGHTSMLIVMYTMIPTKVTPTQPPRRPAFLNPHGNAKLAVPRVICIIMVAQHTLVGLAPKIMKKGSSL